MALSHFSTHFFALCLLVSGAIAVGLNVSGDATIIRSWDCCKPACGWKFKAEVNQPVRSCGINGDTQDSEAGSGCNDRGIAYQCPDQQPWAVNDTFAYGFGAIFLKEVFQSGVLDAGWCCACYQIDFEGQLKGKRIIMQAINSMFHQRELNLLSLSIPGNNFENTYAPETCNTQYGLPVGSYNHTNFGVSVRENCSNVPEALRPACQWNFDWYDNNNNNATFKRVSCPAELTNKTGCVRNDEKQFSQLGQAETSAGASFAPALVSVFLLVAGFVAFLSM